MSDPIFSVELVTENNNKGKKTEAAEKPADTRSLVDRMFTNRDKDTGAVEDRPIRVYNCATETVSAQGYSAWDLNDQIPVFLGYKAGVPDFKGMTKNRDFLVIGKRAGGKGQPGQSGLMIDVNELPQFIERLQNLQATLTPEAVNGLRTKVGLPAHVLPEAEAEVPPTEEA